MIRPYVFRNMWIICTISKSFFSKMTMFAHPIPSSPLQILGIYPNEINKRGHMTIYCKEPGLVHCICGIQPSGEYISDRSNTFIYLHK